MKKKESMEAVPEARFRLYFNETFPIHLVLGIFYRLMPVHTHIFFGTLMMPLNLYSLFPVALFVHTQCRTHTFGEPLCFGEQRFKCALLMHARPVKCMLFYTHTHKK